MNNEQFRRLVLDKPSSSAKRPSSGSPDGSGQRQGSSAGGGTTAALGSRMRSNIPMTPRSVKGVDFARQLAEQHRQSQQGPPTKKFKSSVPKGAKFTNGYQDRALLRRQNEQENEDDQTGDMEQRVRALEEMVKLGQIDNATFERLRKEIGAGGDLNSTYLVKGLDWDLLERVKAGEDVTKPAEKPREDDVVAAEEDVDEELDRVLEKETAPITPKEDKAKKDNLAMAPPPPPRPSTSNKLSRDEILRQLRASRAAVSASMKTASTEQPSEPILGSKFKKISNKAEKKRWIEQDAHGRRKEILEITDAVGKTKRKVRWLDKAITAPEIGGSGLLMPDKNATPLGMEVPAHVAAKAAADAAALRTEDDDDIFEGVGADYDPLGDLDEHDSSSDSGDEEGEHVEAKSIHKPSDTSEKDQTPISQPFKPRNYFSTTTTTEEETIDRSNPLTNDPTILAALKRAAALRQADDAGEVAATDEDADTETLARRKKFLEEARRREAQDSLDIDYGFGSSRIEDEEDEEGAIYDGEQSRGGNKRKRGPKKRKGDKNNASDVLQVLEGRKQGG